MDEHEELTDDASPNRSLGRRRFLAGGVLGALAALLGRAPDAQADTGAPILGGTTNLETETTRLVMQTPDMVAFEVDAIGPALSAASHGDSAVVASSFLTQQPLPLHLPRAAAIDVSDAVGLIAAGGITSPFAVTVSADARVGLIAGGGLDGLISATLTADTRVGVIAAGGLTGGVSVTGTADVLRAGVLGVGGEAVAVTVNASAFGVGGLVDKGLGVAGSVGGARLGGPPDVSVGVSGNTAGDGIAVSGNLFGATGTSPLASAALGVPHSVTVVAYPEGALRSPNSATGGLFLGEIGVLAASLAEGPGGLTLTAGPFLVDGSFHSVTASAGVFLGDIGILAASFHGATPATLTATPTFDRTAVIGVTDVGTAARFEALGSGTGVEVVGPSVFDGPVTFTVGGHATMPKGKRSVTVSNPNISRQDLVTVTLNARPAPGVGVWYVVCRKGSFTLWVTNYVGAELPFSWVAFKIG